MNEAKHPAVSQAPREGLPHAARVAFLLRTRSLEQAQRTDGQMDRRPSGKTVLLGGRGHGIAARSSRSLGPAAAARAAGAQSSGTDRAPSAEAGILFLGVWVPQAAGPRAGSRAEHLTPASPSLRSV